MSDETTPLLDTELRNNTTSNKGWTGIGYVLGILPVVVVVNVNHGFQNIVPLLVDPELTSVLRQRTVSFGFLIAFLATPFWTAYGDRHGRTSVFLITLIGAIFRNLSLILVHHLDLSPSFYLLGVALDGFFGGYTTFRAMMYVSTAEVVPDNLRLAAFGILQGVISLSFYAPDYFAFDVFGFRDLAQLTPLAWILAFIVLPIACLYVVFCLPETLQRQEQPAREDSGTGNTNSARLYSPTTSTGLLWLALCFQAYINATEDGHGRQHWWAQFEFDLAVHPSHPLRYWDITLKIWRCFLVIPLLSLPRLIWRPQTSPYQYSLLLTTLSSKFILISVPIFAALSAILWALTPKEICYPLGVCLLSSSAVLSGGVALIVIPALGGVGLVGLLSFLASYGPEDGIKRGRWWGELSVVQTFGEGIFAFLDDQPLGPKDGPDVRWNPFVNGVVVYVLQALTALVIRLLPWVDPSEWAWMLG